MKFAVIETGAKQYKISEGDIIKVEKLSRTEEYKEGDKITFDKVLLIDDNKDTKIGEPYLDKAKVEAKFIEEARDPKIRIMQFKSKSNYLKRKGHRQTFHKVEITKI
ncbi:MAG: 50S ribosomal protein L21 [Candidatus Pacebacteria bacterium]|nr:50S ribosomal protein L21 [Candidatus Paceibacterota bacterium]